MDFEISGEKRTTLGGLIFQSGTKNYGNWLLGTEVLETFNSFDSNATDNFDRYYRNGSGGWTREATKLLYLMVRWIRYSCNNRKQKLW
jgi:hypothetical protein